MVEWQDNSWPRRCLVFLKKHHHGCRDASSKVTSVAGWNTFWLVFLCAWYSYVTLLLQTLFTQFHQLRPSHFSASFTLGLQSSAEDRPVLSYDSQNFWQWVSVLVPSPPSLSFVKSFIFTDSAFRTQLGSFIIFGFYETCILGSGGERNKTWCYLVSSTLHLFPFHFLIYREGLFAPPSNLPRNEIFFIRSVASTESNFDPFSGMLVFSVSWFRVVQLSRYPKLILFF